MNIEGIDLRPAVIAGGHFEVEVVGDSDVSFLLGCWSDVQVVVIEELRGDTYLRYVLPVGDEVVALDDLCCCCGGMARL